MDCLEGKTVAEFIERSDGFIDVASREVRSYFAPFTEWPEELRAAAGEVRGRTLDVGCGAGRFLLHLQSQGHEVVGIDVSPLALEACRRRGARDVRQMSIAHVDRTLGDFDSVILMGNNFGLFVSTRRAGRVAGRALPPGG
jgi:SAM-dependent methyltransferase